MLWMMSSSLTYLTPQMSTRCIKIYDGVSDELLTRVAYFCCLSQMLRETVREFAINEVRPAALEYNRAEKFNRDLFSK
jgi:hypothetical protein